MFRFTIRDVLWLTALVAVALATWFARPHQPPTLLEYKLDYNLSQADLNKEADERWELAAVTATPQGQKIFYFKRPKQKSD